MPSSTAHQLPIFAILFQEKQIWFVVEFRRGECLCMRRGDKNEDGPELGIVLPRKAASCERLSLSLMLRIPVWWFPKLPCNDLALWLRLISVAKTNIHLFWACPYTQWLWTWLSYIFHLLFDSFWIPFWGTFSPQHLLHSKFGGILLEVHFSGKFLYKGT